MRYRTFLLHSTLMSLSSVICPAALASGFQLNEFAAAGLGRAYSGEGALADTAASASRNPATMTLMKDPSLSLGAIYVDADVNVNGSSPSGRSLRADNIVKNEIIPNFHYVQPLSDRFWLGFSANTNYGLSTHFPDNYPAGSLGGKTQLTTSNLALNGAWKANDYLSLGLGLDAIYAQAELNRTGGELVSGMGLPSNMILSHLKGHRWGYGWNTGILYEVDQNNRFSLTYRSKVKIKFKGNYSSELPSLLNPIWQQAGVYGTDGNSIPGKLDLNLPAVWEVSAWHRVAPQWQIHYSMTYTKWDTFEQLRATKPDNSLLFSKDEYFRNSWRMAVGTTYDYNKSWTLRSGVAFDATAVNKPNRSISIPDQNRLWLAAGTTYHLSPQTSIDLAVAYMHGQSVKIEEGSYTFHSSGQAWLYGLNLNYMF